MFYSGVVAKDSWELYEVVQKSNHTAIVMAVGNRISSVKPPHYPWLVFWGGIGTSFNFCKPRDTIKTFQTFMSIWSPHLLFECEKGNTLYVNRCYVSSSAVFDLICIRLMEPMVFIVFETSSTLRFSNHSGSFYDPDER